MKKAKITRRPAARGAMTLQPSRLRMFLIYVVLFGLAIGAGMLVRLLLYRQQGSQVWLAENWPATLMIIFGGAALMAVIERSRWTLRLVDRQHLEGPTGAFGERIQIDVREIDWERTRRSLASRLKIGNAIYDRSRRRVMLSQWFFEPGPLRELLRAIGHEPPPG